MSDTYAIFYTWDAGHHKLVPGAIHRSTLLLDSKSSVADMYAACLAHASREKGQGFAAFEFYSPARHYPRLHPVKRQERAAVRHVERAGCVEWDTL